MCSSSREGSGPLYVRIDWEADGVPYLAIARPGRPVERIPLDRATVARLVADGAGWLYTDAASRYNPYGADYTEGEAPHVIGRDWAAPVPSQASDASRADLVNERQRNANETP